MKKIYLVDVSSMFFRAFYAIRPLSTPQGVPVNAVYGFLSMIIKLLKDEKPEYIAFCYDRKQPSFRKEMYAEYKANRTEMPEDLEVQIPYIKQVASLLGIRDLEVESYEADDLIGTLTRIGREKKLEVVIVSGDKDFGQLIQPHVVLYDTMKEVRYDVDGVKQKWGIRPDQFIDYLALVGDSSDNIPGVAGIGPKGAIKLLEQFKNLEEIYERIDEVEGKSTKEKLLASKDNAFLSKKLVRIVQDVPVSEDMSEYRMQPMKRDELRQFLQVLNFKTFEKNILGVDAALRTESSTSGSDEVGSESGTAFEKIESDQSRAGAERWTSIALDVESSLGKIEEGSEIYFFQDSRGFYFFQQQEVIAVSTLNDSDFKKFGYGLEKKKVVYSGFDLKSIWHRLGIEKAKPSWDSMLAAYVITTTDSNDFNKVYFHFFGQEVTEFASHEEKGHYHAALREKLIEELKQNKNLEIYERFEKPLIEVLYYMEKKGIRIDPDVLKEQSLQLEKDIKVLEKAIHQLAGETFNIASPKQLAVVLFEKLNLPTGKKTKTGYSTDNDVLQSLDHPVAKEILNYRELTKLKSTYVDALPQLIDPEDGRVHTHFNQALTATGRLSSIAPNLQNIPIKTPRGQMVRQAFVGAGECQLLSVDYSQIELRILAHISADPGLIKAFNEDLDIHAATAAEIYGISLDQVTASHRRHAKAVNFGIAYGQGVFGLAETLGIPRKDAQGIIERYFERFKNVKTYIDSTIQTAHEKGYVETMFGRRRYLNELKSKNPAMRKFGERAAINAPIQGTASDIVKLAMIEIYKKIDVTMLLQVHDELIFEGTLEHLQTVSPKIKDIMETVTPLNVPLKVNLAIGKNWDEAH